MRDLRCIHDICKSIVAHRSKYGHLSWLDHEQISLKQPYQGLGRPYLDDGDDHGLTFAYTKHFHPFCSPVKVLVPRANVWGCLSHIIIISYIPTRSKHNRGPRTTHPTRHTSPHHTVPSTTTTSPYHQTRQRRGTTHNQQLLNTTTARSSTTHSPHYTGSRHTDHGTPPWTRGEPRTRTSSTRD